MPSIMAVPYPTRGHVLIEVNFADVSGATHVCVEAITGEGTVDEVRRQLHPYVSFNSSGCLSLSCGQGIFWDTEISCGTPTVYCATAIDASGEVITTAADPLILDEFTRVVAASWGASTSGQPWTVTSGLAADHLVNGTQGAHNTSVVNSIYEDTIDAGSPNLRFYAEIQLPIVPTGASIITRHEFRRTDASNYYAANVEFLTSGGVEINLVKVVAGVETFFTAVNIGTHVAGNSWSIVAQGWGNQIELTGWKLVDPMPATPSATYTDTSLTSGTLIGARTRREAGNTNGTVQVTWDNVLVTDVCAELVPVESCTAAVTIACDGCFRLGNPVRPCDDVRVCMCADGVECGAEGGLFFVGMTPDTRAANSTEMMPVNDAYPIPISRRRRKPTSNLTISATSFGARDDLINLLDPGEPLLLRTTPEFGIGDRYLQIGDVPETYGLADMTIQPRLLQLPNSQVRAPVGPSLGVCGARVMDMCDIYDTWDEMVAAGLTWADLLRGEASPPGSGLATWDEINAENASWAALLIAEPDWNDVLDGD